MNPVVETFGELYDVLKEAREVERKASLERLKAEGLKQPWKGEDVEAEFNALFSGAVGMYNGVTLHNPWVIKKAPGDTIAYDVNNPATWSNFLPPEFLEAELPATPKQKRKGKK